MTFAQILEMSLYFLALINPASKVVLLSSAEPSYTWKELRTLTYKSTFTAFVILIILALAGSFILHTIFHVNVYSLKIAGGIVLFIVGLTAVRKGCFYEKNLIGNGDASHLNISIVPLGAPLIAGPGTITAAIAISAESGIILSVIAIIFALVLNMLIMLASGWIGKLFNSIYAIGPLVRITGLIVAAVAVQMILTGLSECYKDLFIPLFK